MWPLTATTATPRPVETIAVSRMMVIDHHFARGPNGRPARRQRSRRKPYADSTERPNVPATPANPLGMAPRPLASHPPRATAGAPGHNGRRSLGIHPGIIPPVRRNPRVPALPAGPGEAGTGSSGPRGDRCPWDRSPETAAGTPASHPDDWTFPQVV